MARGVDALGVRPHGQDEHHVGQVDGLAPRRRSHLGEGNVDQQHLSVADEHVGGLDVAVGEPGLPQLAHDPEPLVDDGVVDLGFPDLLGPFEELGDQEVLPLGGQLDHPEWGRGRDPGVPHDAQHVVLLLDQSPHRLERRLVLQPAVEDGAERACTSGPPARGSWRRASRRPRWRRPGARRSGVEPPEPSRPIGPMSTTCRPSWSDTARRMAASRRASMSRWADRRAPVADREELVGGEEAHRQQRQRCPEDDADDHVRRVVGGEVQTCRCDDRDDGDPGRLGDRPWLPRDDHPEHDADDRERDDDGAGRGHREALPVPDRRDVERTRSLQHVEQQDSEQLHGEHAAQEGEQVLPPTQSRSGRRAVRSRRRTATTRSSRCRRLAPPRSASACGSRRRRAGSPHRSSRRPGRRPPTAWRPPRRRRRRPAAPPTRWWSSRCSGAAGVRRPSVGGVGRCGWSHLVVPRRPRPRSNGSATPCPQAARPH